MERERGREKREPVLERELKGSVDAWKERKREREKKINSRTIRTKDEVGKEGNLEFLGIPRINRLSMRS